MDVRTICLGILMREDATGYEIKKLCEDGGYQHFVEASFGSIYPALNRMMEDGLVSVREEAQEKRPDRKVYSITPAGRAAFIGALMKQLPEDRHRSSFMFAMLFSDLLPQERVRALLEAYVDQAKQKLAQIEEKSGETMRPGERFALDLGRTIYTATLEFLARERGQFERAPQAAE
ncbi:MAG TPA: PadR family transcriptional regulator [Rhizomicrobium sp.]|nr:PadR family transcriptional regulator [Rhizomicrobium sp.]